MRRVGNGLAAVLGLALCSSCISSAEPEAMTGSVRDGERVIEIKAERFQFRPSVVRVASGEKVRILLSSEDTTHGFAIDALKIDVLIPPSGRGSATATFVAPAPGTYVIRCSHVCGAGHAQMRGRLIVESLSLGADHPP